MIIKKAFNIRLYPNKGQKNFINKTIGGCKFLYNLCLKSKQYLYKRYGIQYVPKMSLLVEEYPKQLNNIDSQGICNTYQNLKQAYKNWFNALKKTNKCKQKAPKCKDLKSKAGSYRNAMIKKDVDQLIQDDKIYIPCAKWVKFKGIIDKEKIRKVYNITIKRTKSGRYYASLCCDVEMEEYIQTNKAIGLDLGIKDLIIDSNGTKYENKKFLRNSEQQIKHLQIELNRKKKGSKNRDKARIKLAIAHEKLSNRRNNYLHQLTTKIVKENNIICIEDLNVLGMMKNHKLAKSIADCSFSMIRRMLEYKCHWHNRKLVVIDKWSPSSKKCSNPSCNYIYKDITLGVRNWICPNCGMNHDRDINAAKNILNEGIKILNTVGTTDCACGGNSSFGDNTPMPISDETRNSPIFSR